MRAITEKFEDEEYEALKKAKDASGKNWHDFIMQLAKRGDE